jgi:hypothetical protein
VRRETQQEYGEGFKAKPHNAQQYSKVINSRQFNIKYL